MKVAFHLGQLFQGGRKVVVCGRGEEREKEEKEATEREEEEKSFIIRAVVCLRVPSLILAVRRHEITGRGGRRYRRVSTRGIICCVISSMCSYDVQKHP